MANTHSSDPLHYRLYEIAAGIEMCQKATHAVVDQNGLGGSNTVEAESILWLVEGKLRELNRALNILADEIDPEFGADPTEVEAAA